MTSGGVTRAPSATTRAATVFVETHINAGRALGHRLADEVDDAGSFLAAIRDGLTMLADPECLAGQRLVAPGIGPLLGVRMPLLESVYRALVHDLRGVRAARLLPVAEALAREPYRELRWFSCWLLGRIMPDDPEGAWQVIRRLAAEADDWISVDTMAATIAPGILREPFRWAELEQLVYSPGRWERRLVGSTVATIPFADRAAGRMPEVAARGLAMVGLLIGDPEPDVQRALSWALRNMAAIDPAGVTGFCWREGERAAATADGNRAWVVRDTLAKLAPADAAGIRALLAGVRRRPGAANTSAASATAAAFLRAGREAGASPNPPERNRRAIP
ncbi:MAG TPA: DNA alkylation repair protein [Candidatus Limnocylindrales bacterium]|jgi:3-methyladenine DNA glycosylase AlkD